MSEKFLTAAQCAELMAAFDKPMTNVEAVSIFRELGLLLSECIEVAPAKDQYELSIRAIRAAKAMTYIRERLLPEADAQ